MDAIEAAEDVTKRGSGAMAGFYANLMTKNIAMGGDASNSSSAYTVGKKQKTDAAETKETKENEDKEERATAAEAGEGDKMVEKRVTKDENRGSAGPPDDAAPTTTKPSTSSAPLSKPVEQQQPAKPSKEDAISAAKARYLARKAMRATAQAQGDGGTTQE